ncbi:putative chemotaxis protein CheB [Magnetofaba australis IT-1]|uniref:protein-glutamate methylesterase n=2 Tax=Magnetofaba TaxID=1472292 RepID=A0A1Y2JZ87_9PROT|nr:putative chemotaxis protein CheB [Magnetofaba australis IT-1]
MFLQAIFEQEPDIEVVGVAQDGHAGVEMTRELRPDVVTMDIRMPGMDGFEATRLIMSECPTPIVVISSSVDDEEMRITFRAIEEGALAVLEKPHGVSHPNFESDRVRMLETIRAMAEVRVIRRARPRSALTPPAPSATTTTAEISAAPALAPAPSLTPTHTYCELLAIGSSTGGPQALQELLATLEPNPPFPIVVAQHIAPGFISGMISWLNDQLPMRVSLMQEGAPLMPGEIVFAPDNRHMRIIRGAGGQLAAESFEHGVNNGYHCPSINEFFHSVARHCGRNAIGVILSGMGDDGAQGLRAMRDRGALTFAQQFDTCVIDSMPQNAKRLDAVEKVLPPHHIAYYLNKIRSA